MRLEHLPADVMGRIVPFIGASASSANALSESCKSLRFQVLTASVWNERYEKLSRVVGRPLAILQKHHRSRFPINAALLLVDFDFESLECPSVWHKLKKLQKAIKETWISFQSLLCVNVQESGATLSLQLLSVAWDASLCLSGDLQGLAEVPCSTIHSCVRLLTLQGSSDALVRLARSKLRAHNMDKFTALTCKMASSMANAHWFLGKTLLVSPMSLFFSSLQEDGVVEMDSSESDSMDEDVDITQRAFGLVSAARRLSMDIMMAAAAAAVTVVGAAGAVLVNNQAS